MAAVALFHIHNHSLLARLRSTGISLVALKKRGEQAFQASEGRTIKVEDGVKTCVKRERTWRKTRHAERKRELRTRRAQKHRARVHDSGRRETLRAAEAAAN